ncbi:hypothetical protein [Cuspidothrix issatschenkoi]|uniref:Uncharacterized protein n=1 Tax=Cuspidothrix issatschenkoi CHARLIE-1 TaxID=2052836 RepID=A0A2S6CY14_9CYAN|nr:hypothetical protein [Cuspidothrix issatschenkoi]PPJ64646.1 hypothetical protein CUN59_03120 [Cuspidothrix issatschenkoi CHARLIE-1]
MSNTDIKNTAINQELLMDLNMHLGILKLASTLMMLEQRGNNPTSLAQSSQPLAAVISNHSFRSIIW